MSNIGEDKNQEEQGNTGMLTPRIEKVVVNVSLGKSGEPLERAAKILAELTRQNPCRINAKKTIREFGIRKGEPTACFVTLRNQRSEEFLRRALQAIENKIPKHSFDKNGNFSFGIKEHIEFPGTKYDPDLGIIGMDISVSLDKPGYRVKRRHRARSKVGYKHLLKRESAIRFIQDTFGVEVT
jgi:large subunit ribosomal protein L5